MSEYYFELPQLGLLTDEQEAAVNEVSCSRIYGGAGTGKSVVACYRHFNSLSQRKKSILLTYTTTLAHYLEKTVLKEINATNDRSIIENARNTVSPTLRWINGLSYNRIYCDEVIVDEAQDIQIDNYRKLKRKCSNVVYSADANQTLYPELDNQGYPIVDERNRPIIISQLENLFDDNEEHVLDVNFRNTRPLLLFAQAFFSEATIDSETIAKAKPGNKPIFMKVFGKMETYRTIENIIDRLNNEGHNIGILAPFQSNVKDYENYFSSKYDATFHYSDKGDCKEIKNIHFTTFKSSKGLEFHTVIIPSFDLAYNGLNRWQTLRWKDFYVAVTRTKTNLFLISSSNIPNISNYVD